MADEKEVDKKVYWKDVSEKIYKDSYYMIRVFLYCLDHCVALNNNIEHKDKKIFDFIKTSNELRLWLNSYMNENPANKSIFVKYKIDAFLKKNMHVLYAFIHKTQTEYNLFYEEGKKQLMPEIVDLEKMMKE